MPLRYLPGILLLLLAIPTAPGALAAGEVQKAVVPVLGVEELRAGMTGYGKTVFRGDRIGTFDVEILGVLKNWEAKTDMILIKMSGDPIDKTGIISGMSGSPVYIDNKLIGAVSYGWSFAKEAIAGVTPIKDMLNVMSLSTNQAKAGEGSHRAIRPWESSLSLQEPTVKEMLSDMGNPESHPLRLMPIKTPLVVSGFDQRVIKDMTPVLERYGLFPGQGGGGASGTADA